MTQASGTAAAVVSTPVALSLDYGAAAGYIGAPVMSAGGASLHNGASTSAPREPLRETLTCGRRVAGFSMASEKTRAELWPEEPLRI